MPFPVVVRTNVTVPAAISAGVGEYMMFSESAFGLYIPPPPDHVPPVATVIDPDNATGLSNFTLVIVNNVNDAPILSQVIGNQTIGSGGFVNINLDNFFTDIDGDK